MQNFFAKYRFAVQVILFLLGLVLIVAATFVTQPQWSLVMYGIGTSMLAGIIISLLEAALGTDMLASIKQISNFNQKMYSLGLEDIQYHLNFWGSVAGESAR